MTSSDKRARISISSRIQMSQVKGKLGEAFVAVKGWLDSDLKETIRSE